MGAVLEGWKESEFEKGPAGSCLHVLMQQGKTWWVSVQEYSSEHKNWKSVALQKEFLAFSG